MATTTTRNGVITDAFIALLNAGTAVPAVTDEDGNPAKVYDGPVTHGDQMWKAAVFVGFTGDWHGNPRGQLEPGDSYEAVLINHSDYRVGNTSVFETLEIQCCCEAWSGDSNSQKIRNVADSLLSAVETVVRLPVTGPTLGIDGSTIAKVITGVTHYTYDGKGNTGFRIPFVLHVTTYLPTV